MAAAKTAKTFHEAGQTLETIATTGRAQMREGMDRSVAAMAEVGAFTKENVEALVASATATTKGFEALSARAVAFSKTAMENHMIAAKAIMSSKSVQEAMERQAEYARASFDTYVSEMNQMAEILSGVTREAAKPLTERATAVSHLMQSGATR